MRFWYLIILFFILFPLEKGMGQKLNNKHQTSLGLRIWDGAGITFKTFVSTQKAVEGVSYFYSHGVRLMGFYEIYNKTKLPALQWYAGPGIHVSFYKQKYYFGDRAVVGIDGILGLDYKITDAPLSISLDWQPSFEFADKRGFTGTWGGLGVHYFF